MTTPVDDDRGLTAALRAVAAEEDGLGPSPHVEPRLRAEVQAFGRARRRAVLRHSAVAACLSAGVAAAVWLVAPSPGHEPGAMADGDAEQVTEFYPLFYSNVPASDVHLVRLEVSRAALASFGVAGGDPQAGGAQTVLADVLVGEDGLARAIRFVHPFSGGIGPPARLR